MSTQTIMTPQANPRSSLAMATDPGRALHLSSTFQPDVDLLIAEFLLVYGSKGSGKSNLLALLVEQLARFHVPQLILDTEGEFAGLLPFLPRGVLASASACPTASDIVHHGLQVVLDLKSWEEEEQAGQAMAKLIGNLFAVTNAIECTSRWPVVVHLDEAAYWLPQDAVSYLSKETRKTLSDAFHKLASRGRKQGLIPFLYTQSISEIRKETVRQAGVQILMRQILDVDLSRYQGMVYGATSKTLASIRAYPQGKAVVLLPDGSQPRVQFHQRQSPHMSHTPKTQAAISRFSAVPFNPKGLDLVDMTEGTAEDAGTGRRASTRSVKPAVQSAVPQAKRGAIKQQVFRLLDHDASLSAQQIAGIMQHPTNTVQGYRKEYFVQHPEKKPEPQTPRMEQVIRGVLAQFPDLTPSQIAHRTNYSLNDVRKVLTRLNALNVSVSVSVRGECRG